ncbi:polysaccharide pyruvyl transferase family protein [Leptothermofonsia sp. ETS-13]|uniref:polysaccharide pyruvyl transferase family protein n=1 Tax=Leptothermofonsia sp. ETS-13 TaxID=3035696 RepID=UPI003BA2C1E0
MKICLFDPGIESHDGSYSSNLGDLIIQEAVNRELNEIFRNQEIIRFSTHSFLEPEHLKTIRACPLIIVGGTNLLSSNMDAYRQWRLSLRHAFRIRRAILFGVGWWQYQEDPNLYTRFFLKTVLSGKLNHSVRDRYTLKKLQAIGINNVINTGCPTMWPLAGIRSEEFPREKSSNVLVMLTDYKKKPDLDRRLLELLLAKYTNVYVWPQGRGDKQYISDLNVPVTLLEHSLLSLDQFIHSGIAFDYIGTRLHGGVRCLCARKRSLILEVDNRAKEIAQDTDLPTVERDNFDYISQWIDGSSTPEIKLNMEAIQQWKSQFIQVVDKARSAA